MQSKKATFLLTLILIFAFAQIAFAQDANLSIRSLSLGGNGIAILNSPYLTPVWDNPAAAAQTERIDLGVRGIYHTLLDGDGRARVYDDGDNLTKAGNKYFQDLTAKERWTVEYEQMAYTLSFAVPLAKNGDEDSYKGRVKAYVETSYGQYEQFTEAKFGLKDSSDRDFDTWYKWRVRDKYKSIDYNVGVGFGLTDHLAFGGAVLVKQPLSSESLYEEKDEEDDIDLDEYVYKARWDLHPQVINTFKAGLLYHPAETVLLGLTYTHGTDLVSVTKDNLQIEHDPDDSPKTTTTLGISQTSVVSIPREYGAAFNWMAWEGGSLLFEVKRQEVSDPEQNSNVLATSTTDFGFGLEHSFGENYQIRGGLNYADRNGFDTLGRVTTALGAGFYFAEHHLIDIGIAYYMEEGQVHTPGADTYSSTVRSVKSDAQGLMAGGQYWVKF